ncbi:MAG: hypothetical protein MI757_17865 [Pirellulales bacterium]|nr:hypothetical protein [Pirellulales bacterium]
MIDDFADPDPIEIGSGDLLPPGNDNPFVSTVESSPGIIGGKRVFTADWTSAGATIPIANSARIGTGLVLISTASPLAVVVTFEYPDVGGMDISDGGTNDTFLLPFVFIEGGSSGLVSIDITVETSSGTGTYHDDFPESPDDPLDYFAPFADFSGTPDFGDVDSITIVINDGDSSGSLDMRMESPIITTMESVPEPGCALLAYIGVVVCTATRRFSRRDARPPG